MYKLCPCCAKKVIFKLLKTTKTYFIIECNCSYMDKIIKNEQWTIKQLISKIDKKFFSLIDSTYLLSSEASFIFECVTWNDLNVFERANLKKTICGDLDISPLVKAQSISKIEESKGDDIIF